MQLARESNVGDDDDVEGRGCVAGSLAGVAARVVLVLARRASLPRHAALGDCHGVLGGGGGRGAAFCVAAIVSVCPLLLNIRPHVKISWKRRTEVETGPGEGSDHDTAEDLAIFISISLASTNPPPSSLCDKFSGEHHSSLPGVGAGKPMVVGYDAP